MHKILQFHWQSISLYCWTAYALYRREQSYSITWLTFRNCQSAIVRTERKRSCPRPDMRKYTNTHIQSNTHLFPIMKQRRQHWRDTRWCVYIRNILRTVDFVFRLISLRTTIKHIGIVMQFLFHKVKLVYWIVRGCVVRVPLAANWFQSTSTSTSTKRDNALIKTIFCFTFHSVLHALAHRLFALANWRLRRILNLSTGYVYDDDDDGRQKWNLRECFLLPPKLESKYSQMSNTILNKWKHIQRVCDRKRNNDGNQQHRKICWKWKSAIHIGLLWPNPAPAQWCLILHFHRFHLCRCVSQSMQRHDDNYTKSVWNSNLNSQNQMRYVSVSDCSLDFFAKHTKHKEKLNADADILCGSMCALRVAARTH